MQVVRAYTIVTDSGTFLVDIVGKSIVLLNDKCSQVVTEDAEDFDIQKTYAAQMADWLKAIFDPTHNVMSPLSEAVKTAELMLSMKEATA